MTVAVPQYVREALRAAPKLPPGHWFRLYFGGWWTKELEEARVAHLCRKLEHAQENQKRDLKRKLEKSKDRKDTTPSFAEIDNEARSMFLFRVFDGTPEDTLQARLDLEGVGLPQFFPSSLAGLGQINARQREAAKACGALIVPAGVLVSPFTTGLGIEHPLENGFAFLDPYGLPYLPGSGVKGVVRRAAEELALFETDKQGWSIPAVWWLFGFDASSAFFAGGNGKLPDALRREREAWKEAYSRHVQSLDSDQLELLEQFCRSVKPKGVSEKDVREALEGDGGEALRKHLHLRGALEFWDVIPEPADGKLRVDIMNPHYNHYYQNGEPPGDWGSPVPIYFLALPPGTGFTFVVRLRPPVAWPLKVREYFGPRWQDLVRAALAFAWKWQGFGAKTTVGFGRMAAGSPQPLPSLELPQGPGGV